MSVNSSSERNSSSVESTGEGSGCESFALVDFLSYLATWEDGYSWGVPEEVERGPLIAQQFRWHERYPGKSPDLNRIVFLARENEFGQDEEELFSSLLNNGLRISPLHVAVALINSSGMVSEKVLDEIRGETALGRVVVMGELVKATVSDILFTISLSNVVADSSLKRMLWEKIKHLRVNG